MKIYDYEDFCDRQEHRTNSRTRTTFSKNWGFAWKFATRMGRKGRKNGTRMGRRGLKKKRVKKHGNGVGVQLQGITLVHLISSNIVLDIATSKQIVQ